MWHPNGVVARTAFFARTTTPTHDPLGDSFDRQGYNRSPWLTSTSWMKSQAPEQVGSLWRHMRGPD